MKSSSRIGFIALIVGLVLMILAVAVTTLHDEELRESFATLMCDVYNNDAPECSPYGDPTTYMEKTNEATRE